MEANDVMILDDAYKIAPHTTSIQDIIGQENEMYMNLILLSSSVLLVYVIWMNFFIHSKYQKVLDANNIDIHELSILPVLILVITTLSYKGMI